MTLVNLKKMILESSGRYDLYNSNDSIWNLTTFINAGVKYLDKNFPLSEELRWYKKDVAIGDVRLSVADLRAVKEVWAADSDERKLVSPVTGGWLRVNYSDSTSANVTSGLPKYWSYDLHRLAPSQKALTQAVHTGFTYSVYDILFDTGYTLRGIQWMPPADEVYTIELLGTFFSEVLSNASDVNWWTMYEPEAVIASTVLCIERHNRNLEGVRTQRAFIEDLLKGDQDDRVEQELVGNSFMEG